MNLIDQQPATEPPAQAASKSGPRQQSVNLARLALLTATVLTGLSAGFFFAYEASVTLGLAEVSDVTYVETFQAINNTIKNPAFGIVFFGCIPAIALAAATSRRTTGGIAPMLISTALPLYLLGAIVTFAGNVPLNNDLADVEVITPARAAEARAEFEDDWNRLNLLRTLAVGASFTALAAASVLAPSPNDPGNAARDGQTA